MARISNREKLYKGSDAIAWVAENQVYKAGMTKDQLLTAAKVKGAPIWILTLIQLFGPVLLKFLESLLAPKAKA